MIKVRNHDADDDYMPGWNALVVCHILTKGKDHFSFLFFLNLKWITEILSSFSKDDNTIKMIILGRCWWRKEKYSNDNRMNEKNEHTIRRASSQGDTNKQKYDMMTTLDFGDVMVVYLLYFHIVTSCVLWKSVEYAFILITTSYPFTNTLFSDKTTGMKKNEVIILIKPK